MVCLKMTSFLSPNRLIKFTLVKACYFFSAMTKLLVALSFSHIFSTEVFNLDESSSDQICDPLPGDKPSQIHILICLILYLKSIIEPLVLRHFYL